MIRVGREVEYGLIALKALQDAPAEVPVSVRSICDTFTIPFDATSRVLQKLKHDGVVSSTQGVRGGYLLAQSLSEISFLRMLRAIGVPSHVAGCLSQSCDCSLVKVCNIVSPMAVLDERLQAFYESLTLAEMLGSTSPKEDQIRDQSERIPASAGNER